MTTETRSRWVAATAALALAGAAACAAPAQDQLQVWVAFAPLQYVVEQVAGPEAKVQNLTPPGADPHSQELSPARVADLTTADLVVYVSGLQAATDQALVQAHPGAVVDALAAATAEVPGAPEPPDAGRDPHFWLDPVRLGIAVHMVASALGDLDPANAVEYAARAEALTAELDALDQEIMSRLQPCVGATLVTSHEAFGYLAARYGLEQHGITGIDPEVEPSPARLRELTAIIEQTGVKTIYLGSAAAPGVARTLADELGLRTDVLDPMERSEGLDYLGTMRENLDALARGLLCE